jgi:hypothetical protein
MSSDMSRWPFFANRRKRPAFAALALSVFAAAIMGRAQSPTVSAARLHASVQFDSHGVFVYRYTVENGAGSTEGVWKMRIDISLPPGAPKPSAAGLVPGLGYVAESSGRGSNVMTREVVPVALSAPQPGWQTTIGTDGTARWMAIKDASLIFPKQRLAGFSIASHGPPSLRQFSLGPHIDADRAPIMTPGDDPGDVDRYLQDLDRYTNSQTVVGITLGPTAPVTTTADALLASLASQVVQARSLGWISNDGVMRTLSAKLEAARTAVSRRQFETTRTVLQALRDEVAAQSGKNLTSEAVALVDVNIQYALQLAATP